MAARGAAVREENSFIVTIRCEVTTFTERFEELITRDFIAALRNQRGYLGAMLWKSRTIQVTEAGSVESSAAAVHYQLSLKFVDQQAQSEWVKSDVHTALWGKVKSLASSIRADRYQTSASDGDWS